MEEIKSSTRDKKYLSRVILKAKDLSRDEHIEMSTVYCYFEPDDINNSIETAGGNASFI